MRLHSAYDAATLSAFAGTDATEAATGDIAGALSVDSDSSADTDCAVPPALRARARVARARARMLALVHLESDGRRESVLQPEASMALRMAIPPRLKSSMSVRK